jgi:hypothetical protein
MDRVGQDVERRPGPDRQDRLVDHLRRGGAGDEGAEEGPRGPVDDDRDVAARLGDVTLGGGGEVHDLLERVVPGRDGLLQGEPAPATSGSV